VFNLRTESKEFKILYLFPILICISGLYLLLFILWMVFREAFMLNMVFETSLVFLLSLILIDSASYVLKRFKRTRINIFFRVLSNSRLSCA